MEKFYSNFFISNNEILKYFSTLLDALQKNPQKYRDVSNHCLSSNCFASNNLLNLIDDHSFVKNINFILEECQKHIPNKVEYFYIHMIDYENGGDMLIHKHDHNEDYSFVFYLNDCVDGYTTLYLDKPIRVMPEEGKILIFSSNIYHSSTFSKKKKIFVGGLKIS
jgi:hypothetical protein